ncbi:MAG TPA: hypothetical protein VIO11_03410 [Candidatus Methanoperedens sp.]
MTKTIHKNIILSVFAILLISAVFYQIFILALALTEPSYNTEADCRACHGVVADRHHLLVQNSTYNCINCHTVKWSIETQTYNPEVIRDCLVCHPGKNHTETHHLMVEQGLHVCTDCHKMKWDGVNQFYYPEVIWDCTVCHTTVLKLNNDTTPPDSISALVNSTYASTFINWTWIDPDNIDFKEVMIYLDGTYITRVPKGTQYYNASGLNMNTQYGISTHTVDTSGNINQTWKNHTAMTASLIDTTPPGSISALANSTYATTYINWTWIDPYDVDFKEVMIYLDGTYITRVLKGKQYYNASGLNNKTQYGISTQTVDTSGNINQIWQNHTAMTASLPPSHLAPTGSHASIDCSRCHASGKSGEGICYQCHNNSKNSFNGINISYQFTVRNDTFAGFGISKGYYNRVNTRHDISDSDQNYSSTHLECSNCHSAHTASRVNIVIDPDSGTPFNETMIHPGTNEAVADSITFCLRCHDNTWAPNVTGPSIIRNIADVYLDPSAFGDEHGAASGRGNSRLRGLYASRGTSINVPPMPCTDCHDPHGGKGIYHLKTLKDQKGKNYTITSQNINKHDVAHWCSSCHINPMNQLPGKKDNCLSSGCHIHGAKY